MKPVLLPAPEPAATSTNGARQYSKASHRAPARYIPPSRTKVDPANQTRSTGTIKKTARMLAPHIDFIEQNARLRSTPFIKQTSMKLHLMKLLNLFQISPVRGRNTEPCLVRQPIDRTEDARFPSSIPIFPECLPDLRPRGWHRLAVTAGSDGHPRRFAIASPARIPRSRRAGTAHDLDACLLLQILCLTYGLSLALKGDSGYNCLELSAENGILGI